MQRRQAAVKKKSTLFTAGECRVVLAASRRTSTSFRLFHSAAATVVVVAWLAGWLVGRWVSWLAVVQRQALHNCGVERERALFTTVKAGLHQVDLCNIKKENTTSRLFRGKQ